MKELEDRVQDHDGKIMAIFEAIRQLMIPPEMGKRKIGLTLRRSKSPMAEKVFGKMMEQRHVKRND